MEGRLTTTLRIPNKLNKEIFSMSQSKGMTKNSFILNILWDYIKENKGERQKCMNQ